MLNEKGEYFEVIQVINVPRCECGGEFKYTGVSDENREDKYKHACEKCRKRKYFKNVYPKSLYVEIPIESLNERGENNENN